MKKDERDLYIIPEEWLVITNAAYKRHLRYGLLFDFMGQSGFRISEALSVQVKHLNFEKNIVRVRTLKQKEERWDEIIIPPKLMKKIKAYVTTEGLTENDHLWSFTRQAAWRFIKTLLKNLGMNTKKSLHGLRHCHGIMVSELTQGNAIKITKRLRQKTLAMALKYTHLTEKINQEIADGIEEKYLKGD
jgi:integrase